MNRNHAMRAALLVGAVAMAGCTDSPTNTVADQCMRAQIFQQCLKAVPAGPVSSNYNDWSEVVAQCASTAYYQSLRQREHVKPECRP